MTMYGISITTCHTSRIVFQDNLGKHMQAKHRCFGDSTWLHVDLGLAELEQARFGQRTESG
jgi:hypothetical protein